MDHVFAYIGPADLEVAHLLSLLCVASAAIISLLSSYHEEVGKTISDFISGTPCTDCCDKYFLFIFSIKAVECYVWIVNLKSPADSTGDGETMSRCVNGGPSAAFINPGVWSS